MHAHVCGCMCGCTPVDTNAFKLCLALFQFDWKLHSICLYSPSINCQTGINSKQTVMHIPMQTHALSNQNASLTSIRPRKEKDLPKHEINLCILLDLDLEFFDEGCPPVKATWCEEIHWQTVHTSSNGFVSTTVCVSGKSIEQTTYITGCCMLNLYIATYFRNNPRFWAGCLLFKLLIQIST